MSELSHVTVVAPGTMPTEWILILHGILGTKSNWRVLARRIVEAHPRFGALLVDLRMHGDSQGFAPPHTVEACADDLLAHAAKHELNVRGVIGHSFGGKVALAYFQKSPRNLEDIFLIDSLPGARPTARGSEGTLQTLDVLDAMPKVVPTREAFIATIVEAGLSQAVAQWLAMNLVRAAGEGFTLKLDLSAIRALIRDYFDVDLWPVVEHPPYAAGVHMIIGDTSDVFDASDRKRALSLVNERTTFDVVANAGHWVHVDAPEAMLALIDQRLRESSTRASSTKA
ncbi:MAG: alpha/beta hydrolase [Sandaracinaceae bacterium]|nr:alpha/beta hydrolase [Sandaracinaceae bacterium]